ncbi:MAG: 30S ribosomal protein S16 [bacterium ADurb.Bin212]|nr:MAG: 30S ribosomal protein S16 [bacterium ADurb.Bin212]
MVVIRLSRVGKKNSPAYRVVVADKRRAAKRKYIEVIGHYNPTQKPKVVEIDKDRALLWISKGAKPSDTVNNLMADLGIIKKSDKINKVYGKAKKKKADEKGESPAGTEVKSDSSEQPEAEEEKTAEEVPSEEVENNVEDSSPADDSSEEAEDSNK